MEFYPICDESFQITPNLWYVISGNGEQPFMRVGHSIVHVSNKSENNEHDNGKLYIIGGANPSGCFNDIYTLDLNKLDWLKLAESSCLPQARYEHSCFEDSNSKNIFIFGGSCENGNLNDTLKYDLSTNKWSSIKFDSKKNNIPTSRTQHIGCVFRNQLVVYGGGECGSEAVNDQKVYIFDPVNTLWLIADIKCDNKKKPSVRHGHLMLNYMDKHIYLHGGMHNNNFYNDLWLLNLDELNWSCLNKALNKPCGRAAHGGTCTTKSMYLFGGLDSNGCALNDFWKYDIDTDSWAVVNLEGSENPTSRLDFAYCKVTLNVAVKLNKNETETVIEDVKKVVDEEAEEGPKGAFDKNNCVDVFDSINSFNPNLKDDSKFVVNSAQITEICEELNKQFDNVKLNSNESSAVVCNNNNNENVEYEKRDFFIIHGGMDTLGSIFDDCFIINLVD